MVTELQAKMLKEICRSEHTAVNGAEPKCVEDVYWVWASDIIVDAVTKGVFTTLLVAGLVVHDGKRGRDACVSVTLEGFNEYKALV